MFWKFISKLVLSMVIGVRMMVSKSTSIEESSRLEYLGYQRMAGGPNV